MLEHERHKLEVNTVNSVRINVFFSIHTSKLAIRHGHNTSSRRDGSGYEMFKHTDDMTGWHRTDGRLSRMDVRQQCWIFDEADAELSVAKEKYVRKKKVDR